MEKRFLKMKLFKKTFKTVTVSTFTLVAVSFLLISFSISPVWSITVVNDHFDNGTLDPAWSTSFTNTSGWTSSESGTNLTATDITAINTDIWATVTLSQSFTPLTDFNLDFDISWVSQDGNKDVQYLSVSLFDSADNLLALASFSDNWFSSSGSRQASAGGSGFTSGEGSMPLTGSASIDISRVGSDIDVFWDSGFMVSGTNGNPVTKISMEFAFFPSSTKATVFGTESIDLITLEGTAVVPEPTTIALLGISIAGLVGVGARRRFMKVREKKKIRNNTLSAKSRQENTKQIRYPYV